MKKLPAKAIRASILKRIKERTEVDPSTGCNNWTAGRFDRFGYARLKAAGKEWLVHRLTYGYYVGKIPVGLCVLHKCDNPSCVNTEHLFLGTKKDNFYDMRRKGRHTIAVAGHKSNRGELSGRAKLKNADIPEIKKLRAGGELLKNIASRYGVSGVIISSVIHGRHYSNVK